MSKRSRGKKGEAKVAQILEGIKEYHHLFHDVTLVNATSEMTHQIDHILIHPNGVFVIETKNYYGTIEYDEIEEEWYKIVGEEKIRFRSPLKQNKAHAVTLRKALKAKCKPIPVVVFVKENAPYLPDENVINLSDLLLFIDSYPYEKQYTKAEMDELKDLIASVIVEVSAEEHLENIEIMKQVRKELEAEMTYAIEKGICPRCDHKMKVDGYSYHCSFCEYHFKL